MGFLDDWRRQRAERKRSRRAEELRERFGINEWRHDVLCDYREDTISDLLRIKSSTNSEGLTWHVLYGLLQMQGRPARVPEVLRFGPTHIEDLTNKTSVLWFIQYLDSLHGYDQLPACEDYSTAPAAVQEQCDALLTVSRAVYRSVSDPYEKGALLPADRETGRMILADRRLVSLLLKNPGHAERIANIIRERGTADHETILVAMGTGNVLDQGVL